MPVLVPYRLDLTVAVLRRLSTNVVDVFSPQGQYIRALGGFHTPVIVRVAQERADSLAVAVTGSAEERNRARIIVARMLGVDRDLTYFDRRSMRIPWLRALARRMRGVKPPRYPSLWEACVNTVVFQQLSLIAASAIVRRMIVALTPGIRCDGIPIHAFPSVESFQGAKDSLLRRAGLSPSKLGTLRRVSDALASGSLSEGALEKRSSSDAAELLCQVKGIGPWSAALILLRGMGRLDVFPANDSSVTRNLAFVSGSKRLDVATILQTLGRQKGMLYYYLLLARLAARGEIDLVQPERLRP